MFPAIKNFMKKLDEKDKGTIEDEKDLNLLANDNRSRNNALNHGANDITQLKSAN